MNGKILILVSLILFGILFGIKNVFAWWDPNSLSYKKMVKYMKKLLSLFTFLVALLNLPSIFALVLKATIHNPNSYDLIDYQVRIDLSKYLSQPTNLIVCTNPLNCVNTRIPFCYEQQNGECNTNPSTVIWVKVNLTANSNTTIWIKTSDVNYAVNGDNVFDFYDDFNGNSLDLNKWEVKQLYSTGENYLSYSIENGYLILSISSDGNRVGIVSKDIVFSGSKMVEWKVEDATSNTILIIFHDIDELYENIPQDNNKYNIWRINHGGINLYSGQVVKPPFIGFDYMLNRKLYFGVKSKGVVYIETAPLWEQYRIGVYGYFSGIVKVDWIRVRKYADQEPTVNIESADTITIVNKRNKEFVSLVHITVKITSYENSNVVLKLYLNNTLEYSESFTIRAGQSLFKSYTYEILKVGTYEIKACANFTDIDYYTCDSFTFTLDLYDFDYADSKAQYYTSIIDKSFSLRCGALGHSVTVEMYIDNTKVNQTTIPCDNSTSTYTITGISDIEGNHNLYLKLVAVDQSDNIQLHAITITQNLYDLNIIDTTKACYVSPCNFTIKARCGLIHQSKPLKIKEWLNNQIYDVPCDNQTHTVIISEDVINLHNQLNIDVLVQAFSPVDNYQQVVRSRTFTITKVDLYDLYNLVLEPLNVYNDTKYGNNVTVKLKARCGVLNHNVNLKISKDESNYEILTVTCDNSTKEYSVTFVPSTEGNKTVEAILYDIYNSPVESKSDWYIADLYHPELILYYDLTSDNYLVTKLIVEDSISPVAYCTVVLNNEKIADNQLLQVNKEYTWTSPLEYGYNNLTVNCEDLGFHTASKHRLISVAPNIIKTLEWDHPHVYYVGEKAKIVGKFTVINVGEAPIVQPLVESIPFTYGENLKIYIEGTGEVVFKADKWTGPIPIKIEDLPAGERRTYIIEYEIPTVYEIAKKEYFVIEGGVKYNVYQIIVRSKAPIMLDKVYYRTVVEDCNSISKVTVDDIPVMYKCSKKILRVYLGSFAPSQQKMIKIFSKGSLKVPDVKPPKIPEISDIVNLIVATINTIINYIVSGAKYIWNLISQLFNI